MKKLLEIVLIGGLIFFMTFGCEKYGDFAPGVAVYKTRGDYFDKVSVGINKQGKLYHYPGFYNSGNNSIDPRIKITDDDTVYARRAKLINGYIMSHEIGDNSIFLDFTFKEFIKLLVNNPQGINLNVLQENILDDDPFLVLYFDMNRPRKYSLIDSFSDTVLINQMIRDGELGKYFERVK